MIRLQILFDAMELYYQQQHEMERFNNRSSSEERQFLHPKIVECRAMMKDLMPASPAKPTALPNATLTTAA